MKQLLTRKEAAARLRIGVRTLHKLVAAGEIVPVRLGRSVRFTLDELVRYVVQLQATARADNK